MRTIFIIVSIGLSLLPIWAQQAVHHSTHVSRRQGPSLRVRSLSRRGPAASVKTATAPPPAPGVVQIHVEQGNLYAYFVATSTIPQGSSFSGFISSDNGSELDFDSVTFDADFEPGDDLFLPQISNFGDLWPQGTITVTVDVTIGGVLTEANGEFFVGASPTFSDLQGLLPVLSTTSQSINSGREVILAIRGSFTNDAPLVVLGSSTLGNTVVPASAITSSTSGEIDVDLSQVNGLDLSTLNEYLLTVSQAGFADTIVYRYVPARPGTFNQPPQS